MRLDFSDLNMLLRAFKDRTMTRTRRRKRHETYDQPPVKNNEVANFFEALLMFNKLVEEQRAKEEQKEKERKEKEKKPPVKNQVDTVGLTIFLVTVSIMLGLGMSFYFALTFMETVAKLPK